jgi:hypothetical protein
MRDRLAKALASASGVLAEILSNEGALKEWMQISSMDKTTGQETLTIRAVVVLMTLCVNENYDSRETKDNTAHLIKSAAKAGGSAFIKHLPSSFKVWISRFALKQELLRKFYAIIMLFINIMVICQEYFVTILSNIVTILHRCSMTSMTG